VPSSLRVVAIAALAANRLRALGRARAACFGVGADAALARAANAFAPLRAHSHSHPHHSTMAAGVVGAGGVAARGGGELACGLLPDEAIAREPPLPPASELRLGSAETWLMVLMDKVEMTWLIRIPSPNH